MKNEEEIGNISRVMSIKLSLKPKGSDMIRIVRHVPRIGCLSFGTHPWDCNYAR